MLVVKPCPEHLPTAASTRLTRSVDLPSLVPRHMTFEPKLNIKNQVRYAEHRSGWGFALDSLAPLHKDAGLFFRGYLEQDFSWQRKKAITRNTIPYKHDWCGFLHGAILHPKWFSETTSLSSIATLPEFRKSLPSCKGIFVLSQAAAAYLRSQCPGLKVCALKHPTEIPEVKFSWDKWQANPRKRVMQLGWFLRKLDSIYRLPVTKYHKTHLLGGLETIQTVLKHERAIQAQLHQRYPETGQTEQIKFLANDDYDEMLASNLVFVHLHAASANNAVIECMARGTPIAVNPLPSVVEYLGADYPLYFRDLGEAAKRMEDDARVKAAYQYLQQPHISEQLTGARFLQDFANSEIYQELGADNGREEILGRSQHLRASTQLPL